MSGKTITISFFHALYAVNMADRKLIPHAEGVYILREGRRLYCGRSDDLRRRIPESVSKRRFGETAFFFSEDLLQIPEGFPIEDMFANLEIYCISALHTLIWGNGLPLDLDNHDHVSLLPPSAWAVKGVDELNLAIRIAQAVLYTIGFPRTMIELPFYQGLEQGLPAIIAAEHADRWDQIFETERKTRTKEDHAGCPMVLMHPA